MRPTASATLRRGIAAGAAQQLGEQLERHSGGNSSGSKRKAFIGRGQYAATGQHYNSGP
jgi:hypothetical protein